MFFKGLEKRVHIHIGFFDILKLHIPFVRNKKLKTHCFSRERLAKGSRCLGLQPGPRCSSRPPSAAHPPHSIQQGQMLRRPQIPICTGVAKVPIGTGVPCWRYRSPSWCNLSPSWCHLSPACYHLGPSWHHLSPSWRRLGPYWRHLADILAHLGAKMCEDGLQEALATGSRMKNRRGTRKRRREKEEE